MQQVPNRGDCTTSDTSPSSAPRWSRIPRMQLLRNSIDQRVPFYIDQTVPVWPLRQTVRRSRSSNATPGSRSPTLVAEGSSQPQENGSTSHRESYVVVKSARKFAGISQTTWFRGIKGALRTSNVDALACNVSEMLRECACDANSANSSSKWSGIEQDLFTCTSVDPEVLADPSAADFVSNKKSKGKSHSPSEE